MSLVSDPLSTGRKVSEEEHASLERLLASEAISRAPRLQAVLKFIIDSLLEGRTDQVNEQAIGQAVFGRPAGYNPADDNIVRVTVRHLRARLEEFYRTEGRTETCVLEIPKGKYIPILVSRTGSAAVSVPTQEAVASPSPELLEKPPEMPDSSPETPNPSPSRLRIWWALTALLLVGNVILLCILFGVPGSSRMKSSEPVPERGALQLLLQHGNRITVVLTDSNLQAYREIFKKQVPLDAYIDRSYGRVEPGQLDPTLAGAWHYATGTTETSVTSAIVAAEIQKAAGSAVAVDIKHPHDLSMRDIQRENLILLGGPWINPWGQMFEQRLNFRVLPRDGVPAGSEIHNLSPLPGEPKVFVPHQERNININYVRIALLPNLSNNGRVLLIGATSLESLEAGGDFVVSDKSIQSLLQLFKAQSVEGLPFFEIVLEVRGLDAVPNMVHVVAYRTLRIPS